MSNWIRNHKIIWGLILTLAALIAISGWLRAIEPSQPTGHSQPSVTRTASRTPTPPSPSAAPSSQTPTPYPTAGSPNCDQQMITWRDNGGLKNTKLLATDISNTGSAASAIGQDMQTGAGSQADSSTLYSDAEALYYETTVIQHAMPPSCVPNLDRDFGQALADEQQIALSMEAGVKAFNQGDATTALADITHANDEISAGDTATQNAVDDMNAFNNQGN